MNNAILENYFAIFFSPFKVHKKLAATRYNLTHHLLKPSLQLLSSDNIIDNQESVVTSIDENLNLTELIICSWPFAFVAAFWKLLTIFLGLYSYKYLSQSGVGGLDWPAQTIKMQSFITIEILFEMILFPLYAWIYVKVWKEVISFSLRIFNREERNDEAVAQVASFSIVSSAYSMIPILGGVAKNLAGPFYIYAGLRQNLGLSRLQGLLTIVSPLIFLSLISVVFFIMFFLTLASLF